MLNLKNAVKMVRNFSNIYDKRLVYSHAMKISSDGEKIVFGITDLDNYLLETVESKAEVFSCTVPFSSFANVIKSLKSDFSLEMDTENKKLFIVSGDIKAGIETDCPDNFPEVSNKKLKQIEVNNPKSFIKSLVIATAFTVKEKLNKAYSGVLISNKNEIVSTDVHRLLIIESEHFTSDINFVIPADSIKTLWKIHGGNKGNFFISDIWFIYENDKIYYQTRTIKNEFPNYRMVIDTKKVSRDSYIFTTNRENFIEKLNVVIASYDRKDHQKPAVFAFNENSINVFNNTIDVSVESKTVRRGVPDFLRKGLNCFYVSSGVSAFDSKEITLSYLERSLCPLTVSGTIENSSAFYLCMPLRMDLYKAEEKTNNTTGCSHE